MLLRHTRSVRRYIKRVARLAMNSLHKILEELDNLTDHAVPQIVFEGKEPFRKLMRDFISKTYTQAHNTAIEEAKELTVEHFKHPKKLEHECFKEIWEGLSELKIETGKEDKI